MPSQRKTILFRVARKRKKSGGLIYDFGAKSNPSRAHPADRQPRVDDILHDLKAPLSRMTVALGLARQQTGPNAKEALDRIELEAEKLGHMLRQVLELARAELEMNQQASKEIDLLDLLKEVAADAHFESIHSNRKVRLLRCMPCTIFGVKDQLRSALENVVRNALAHTAEGTAVEISLKRPKTSGGSLAIVSVRDHGHGVPPKLLGEIFRPFFRVPDSPGGKLGGTGLGLGIAERAVKLHGGSITAANHPGGGLLVEIQLPAKARLESNIAYRSASASVLSR